MPPLRPAEDYAVLNLEKTVRDSGGASHSKRVKVLKRQQRCHAQADGGTTDATGAGRFGRGKAPIWTEGNNFVLPYSEVRGKKRGTGMGVVSAPAPGSSFAGMEVLWGRMEWGQKGGRS